MGGVHHKAVVVHEELWQHDVAAHHPIVLVGRRWDEPVAVAAPRVANDILRGLAVKSATTIAENSAPFWAVVPATKDCRIGMALLSTVLGMADRVPKGSLCPLPPALLPSP